MTVKIQMPKANLLDRAIQYVSPRHYLRRMSARFALNLQGGYVGARTEREALRNWEPGTGSADADSLIDLPELRARTRDLDRNSGIARGATNTKVTSVVGTGLRISAQVDRDLLGLSEEQATAWERQAERVWSAVNRTLDIERKKTFMPGLQDLAYRSTKVSGDLFVVRRFKRRRSDLLGTKVQLVEADRVCNPNHVPDTDRFRGGVEFDDDGAPIRYHVMNRHPGDISPFGAFKWAPIPAFGNTGSPMVLHVHHAERPGQTRGVPDLAPVIEPLKQLDRYSEAELMAAVVSAMFTVFIKAAEGQEPAALTGQPHEGQTEADDELTLGYGLINELQAGEEIQTADPKRPNDKFDPFVVAILRQIGAAIQIPFELLIKHFTASYSAARAALLEAWRHFLAERRWFADEFCQPIYEWVIEEAIASEILEAPGFLADPLIRRAWLGADWVGPVQGQIDPLREINAGEKQVNLGVKTLRELTAEMTGGDWERKHEQRMKEERMRREGGLAGEVVGTA
jgi:lambda family phage portal protein